MVNEVLNELKRMRQDIMFLFCCVIVIMFIGIIAGMIFYLSVNSCSFAYKISLAIVFLLIGVYFFSRLKKAYSIYQEELAKIK
jgi:hypothetical protein